MGNQDAFIIVPVSVSDSIGIQVNCDCEIHDLLMRFDKELHEKCNMQIKIVSLEAFNYKWCQQFIKDNGITAFMSMQDIKEDILHKTNDRYSLTDSLRSKLLNISPSNELIIIDGYVFQARRDEKPEEHLKFFMDIFSQTISSIKSLKFITFPGYNESSYALFRKELVELNPNLDITCNTTKEIHDRFWIADRTQGLVVGTSLNGIGKKYALFDMLSEGDTKSIVDILKEQQLLN